MAAGGKRDRPAPEGREVISRRVFVAGGLAAFALPALAGSERGSVAGIELPRTPLSRAARDLSRRSSPGYLYNHCMRTYVFGALVLRHRGQEFDAEAAFAAAALHDLGLLPAFETGASFERDGANAAKAFALKRGVSAARAQLISDAVFFHDNPASGQAPEVLLVAAGAAADVIGPDPSVISPASAAAVLAAFPRLGFKTSFKDLLTAHCRRHPDSQHGTWLDGYCRASKAGSAHDRVTEAIENAPFND